MPDLRTPRYLTSRDIILLAQIERFDLARSTYGVFAYYGNFASVPEHEIDHAVSSAIISDRERDLLRAAFALLEGST